MRDLMVSCICTTGWEVVRSQIKILFQQLQLKLKCPTLAQFIGNFMDVKKTEKAIREVRIMDGKM